MDGRYAGSGRVIFYSDPVLRTMNAKFRGLLEGLSFPITAEDLIAAIGSTRVTYPTGKVETLEQVCRRVEVDSYDSAEDAELAIRSGLDGDAVGRPGYSDRDPPLLGIDDYDQVSPSEPRMHHIHTDQADGRSTATVRAVVAHNPAGDRGRTIATDGGESSDDAEPKLLSGGNPQIPKGDGDEPVQSYIAAMPGWKQDVGRRLDALVEATVPDVQRAVRWNSPFYGIDGRGWFMSYHCFTNYVKVTFFRGTALEPVPPVESAQDEVRYAHVHEDDELEEEQWASWIEQAAALPGEELF